MMIFEMSRRDAEESANPFMKSKRIDGNPKSIFAKIKNTFGKIKNYIHVFNNQLAGNNLKGYYVNVKFAGKKLQFMEII